MQWVAIMAAAKGAKAKVMPGGQGGMEEGRGGKPVTASSAGSGAGSTGHTAGLSTQEGMLCCAQAAAPTVA